MNCLILLSENSGKYTKQGDVDKIELTNFVIYNHVNHERDHETINQPELSQEDG
jgi:hypothetical protein